MALRTGATAIEPASGHELELAQAVIWTPEAINHAKDARRGVAEQKPVGGKKRQAKPVIVEYRFPEFFSASLREWHRFGSYADVKTAQQVIANKTRTRSHAEYRIKP